MSEENNRKERSVVSLYKNQPRFP